MIDDFCISNPADWILVGNALITRLKQLAKIEGASQILVVCGTDESKKQFLKNINLTYALEWYVGKVV